MKVPPPSWCVAWLAGLCGFFTGCRTPQREAALEAALPPLAELGRVGLISTSSIPRFHFTRPQTSEEILAGSRPKKFAPEAVLAVGMSCPPASLYLLGGIAAGHALYAGISCVRATTLGVPEPARNRADELIREEAVNFDLQGRVLARLEEWLEERAPQTAFRVAKPLPPDADESFRRISQVASGTFGWLPQQVTPQSLLRRAGADTALEVALAGTGIYPTSVSFYQVRTEATVRLWRTRDGTELGRFRVVYAGATRRYGSWAQNGAGPLLEELEQCAGQVAREIADRLVKPRAELVAAPR